MLKFLSAIWQFRNFILSSIVTEFRSRFSRSRIGFLWVVIFPLVQASLFALVLSSAYSGRPPQSASSANYGVYLLAGMLAWAGFSEIVSRCLTVFIDNSALLKKLVFPRICLPIIVCGSAIVTNVALLLATLAIYLVMGHFPGLKRIWLPVLFALNTLLALGLGLIFGVLNVFMRDVGHLVSIGLQLLFWLTPVVYLPSAIPEQYQQMLKLNPLYYVVQGYQDVLVFNRPPPLLSLLLVFALTAVLLGLALALFRRASEEMVDVL